MCTVDRIRIKHPDGTFSVRDYTFSQSCKLLSVLTEVEKDEFFNKNCVITKEDTEFALAGSELKFMREV